MPTDPASLAPDTVETLYRQARELVHLAPGASLVQSRSALALLVRDWLERSGRRPRSQLYTAVQDLVAQPGLADLTEPMKQVRLAGNAGAHPEQRPHRLPDSGEALDALRALHGLLSRWAVEAAGVDPDDLAAFVPPTGGSWGSICERAVLEGDAAAMALMAGELERRARAWFEDDARKVGRGERMPDTGGGGQLREALRWFDRAALAGGDPAALGDAARIRLAELSEEIERGLADLQRAAEQGDAQSQVILGNLFAQTPAQFGLETDAAQAARWYRAAAEQDHPTALNNLGAAFMYGRGVPRDEAEGRRLFERAATLGFHEARVNLAMFLLPRVNDLGPDALRAFTALLTEIGAESKADQLCIQFEAGFLSSTRQRSLAFPMQLLDRAVALGSDRARARRATLLAALARGTADRVRALEDGVHLLLNSRSAVHRSEARRALYQVWRDTPLPPPAAADFRRVVSLVATARIFLDAELAGGIEPGREWSPGRVEVRLVAALQRLTTPGGSTASEGDVELLRQLVPRLNLTWSGQAVLRPDPLPAAPVGPDAPCPCGSGRPAVDCCVFDDVEG